MKPLDILFEELQKLSAIDQQENIEPFLDKVDEIIAVGDPACIPVLLEYFNDDSEYSWVLESIKLSLEHLPAEIYVKEILANLKIMMPHAKSWALSFLYPMFNEPSYFKLLKQFAYAAPKSELLQLLNLINDDSIAHRPLVKEIQMIVT